MTYLFKIAFKVIIDLSVYFRMNGRDTLIFESDYSNKIIS